MWTNAVSLLAGTQPPEARSGNCRQGAPSRVCSAVAPGWSRGRPAPCARRPPAASLLMVDRQLPWRNLTASVHTNSPQATFLSSVQEDSEYGTLFPTEISL